MRDSAEPNRHEVVRHRATGRGKHVKRRVSGRGRQAIVAGALVLAAGGASAWALIGDSAAPLDPTALTGTQATASSAADRSADRASRNRGEAAPTTNAAPPKTTTSPPTPKSAPATTTAPTPTKTAAKTVAAYVLPMDSFELTSCYGPRWGTEHQGIDLANDAGTPIRAVRGGTVIMAGDNGDGYGRKVVIDHGGWYTLYGHGERVIVSEGQTVSTGQVISYEGSTGDSTGPHLHFEVWTALWSRIDPAPWLRSKGLPLNGC